MQVYLLRKKIDIIAVYRRPGKQTSRKTWINIINKCKRGDSIIMAGDFNAHHTMWNCEDCDYNGELLLEETEEKYLFVINKDTCSRMGNMVQRDSNLDLIFCSTDMVELIEYQQIDNPWDSDHPPIEFYVGINLDRYEKKTN